MTTPPHAPGKLRARWHAWRSRPRYVTGGNVNICPPDGRTRKQREQDELEMRIMLYLITQRNTYLY